MSDKNLYLLAKFDDETQNKLTGYYDILTKHGFIGNQTKNIPYHFTLGSCGVDCETELLIKLNEICLKTKCFDINFAYIGLFGLNVLFIAPNMNFELQELQNNFFSDCGHGYHSWSAHATLLIDEPQTILKALPIIANNFKPFKARIESLALYEFFPARFINEFKLINESLVI